MNWQSTCSLLNLDMTSIPIALCGKDPATCRGLVQGMLPEYDVVHICHNAEAAVAELPKLFANHATKPTADTCSNMERSRARTPKAILVGGGFTDAEFEEMRKEPIVRTVPWMYPPASVRARGKGPPPVGLIVAQARRTLTKHGLVPGREGTVEPGVW
ncbi:hypothetical protein DOTSEDRAFT_151270, partial [Dothistroma septosporum NZE10]